MNDLKRCPKCRRFMVDEHIKTGRNWQTIWHCLCGHTEVDRNENKSLSKETTK